MMYKPNVAGAYQIQYLGVREMAKARSDVNRSEAIRQAFNELPDAKAKDIVAHLKLKGIEVSEGLVYQVKKTSKKKKLGKARVVAPVQVFCFSRIWKG
jgi:hypothetical protein